jgi:hypothetical protein
MSPVVPRLFSSPKFIIRSSYYHFERRAGPRWKKPRNGAIRNAPTRLAFSVFGRSRIQKHRLLPVLTTANVVARRWGRPRGQGGFIHDSDMHSLLA